MINFIAKFINLESNAFAKVSDYLEGTDGYDSSLTPPTYLKICTIETVQLEENEIIILASNNLPCANTGDGVAVNGKAARLLSYGIPTTS